MICLEEMILHDLMIYVSWNCWGFMGWMGWGIMTHLFAALGSYGGLWVG